MPGWLAAQLPRVLAYDRTTRNFVSIFEGIADGIRSQIDALEYYVDVDTAPPEFVAWLGRWMGITVEASLPVERQREIVRAAGRLFAIRGTAAGLRGILEAITGGEVRITDGGGVWRSREAPPNPGRILVRVTQTGVVDEAHLHRLIAQEVPVGVSFDLRMGDRTIEPEEVPPIIEGGLPPERGTSF